MGFMVMGHPSQPVCQPATSAACSLQPLPSSALHTGRTSALAYKGLPTDQTCAGHQKPSHADGDSGDDAGVVLLLGD